MANFKVVVELTAVVEYEVEVEDCDSYREAEEKAINLWRDKLPDDFQAEKGYIQKWEAEAEQTSWECQECGKEISEEEYRDQDEMCLDCLNHADRSLGSIPPNHQRG